MPSANVRRTESAVLERVRAEAAIHIIHYLRDVPWLELWRTARAIRRLTPNEFTRRIFLLRGKGQR